MPLLVDEPELQFTRRLFQGATGRSPNSSPQEQIGAWMVFQHFLTAFEQSAIWPAESVSAEVMQTYRAFVTTVLGMGEHLLTLPLSPSEKEDAEAAVRSLRDKLILEFSEATPEQSENILASIFGRSIFAA